MKRQHAGYSGILGMAAGMLLAGVVEGRAEVVEFTLDPDRSTVGLAGKLLGFDLQEQGAGSLSTKYDGTIAADLTGSTITFLGTGKVVARESGTWKPNAGGVDGSAPANYAGKASTFFASAEAAVRHLEFSATSVSIPLANGTFDSAAILFQFPLTSPAVLDYRVSGLLAQADQVALAGYATNRVATQSTLTTSGDTQTLTIPVEAVYLLTLVAPNDVSITLTGQLVATRTVGGGGGTTLDDYLATQFPGESNPAIVGPGANPDNDPLPNFVEYAFGLNAKVPDVDFAPLTVRLDATDTGKRILEYIRAAGTSGVSFRIETSIDTVNWIPLNTAPVVTDLGNGQEKVVVTDAEPVAANAFRLLRITVSRP